MLNVQEKWALSMRKEFAHETRQWNKFLSKTAKMDANELRQYFQTLQAVNDPTNFKLLKINYLLRKLNGE